MLLLMILFFKDKLQYFSLHQVIMLELIAKQSLNILITYIKVCKILEKSHKLSALIESVGLIDYSAKEVGL